MNALNNNTQWGSKQGVEEEKWNKAYFAQEDDDGDYNDGSLRRLVWNHCFVAWRKRELVICKTWKHGNNIPPCIYETIQKRCEHTNFLYHTSMYWVVCKIMKKHLLSKNYLICHIILGLEI